MKRKKSGVLLAAAMSAVLLSGCQNKDTAGSLNVYYAAIEDSTYYEDWVKQLGEQAEARGYGFDVGYAQNSVETQDAQIKEACANGCDVLLCGPVSADIVTELKASAGDTPIVFMNYAPYDEQLEKNRYIYVASDEYQAGQYQAEYILEQFGDRDEINVVLMKGPKGASGTEGRTNGLKRTLKASGKTINYVFEDYANYSIDTAREFMEMFLKTGGSFDCVVGNNDDMAIGALEACEAAGVDTAPILFLGVDASADGCQAISDGRMDFTVYQPMAEQMTAAIEAVGRLAAGQSIKDIEGATEDEKYILIPFEKVDAGNVEQYK